MKTPGAMLRDEIEETVKALGIDRTRFYEYSKQRYEDILKQFYQTFFDLPRRQLQYEFYPWTNIRRQWKKTRSSGYQRENGGWNGFLEEIHRLLPADDDRKLLLITSNDFVYEGYPQEIFAVLGEATGLLQDFYLVSPKFEWLVVYSDDADCATLYEKEQA
ncbi:MAG: hypothetical protein IJL32_08825 [Oscillospiraceae bacterium]|nr:hypothetical protein [Oscillospiraceae bacterium]